MNDDVRDQNTTGQFDRALGRMAYHAVNEPYLPGEPQPDTLEDALEMVGRNLRTALADAGKVVVDRERFERVILVARNARDYFRSMHGGQDTASDYRRRALEFELGASIKALKVDDLDPLPERGE